MYEIYGKATNRGFRLIWLLEELGEPYELHDCGPHAPEVLALNPSGKVPVVRVDGEVLTDSVAIMTYLADRHGKFGAPAGTIGRGKLDGMLYRLNDELDAVLWTAARHSFVLPKEQRVPEVKASLRWEFKRNLERLAEGFEGPYLMGGAFTIADILLVHCLNWAVSAKFEVSEGVLTDYAKRVRGREAFKRARERAKA